jgi:hypothetical protein
VESEDRLKSIATTQDVRRQAALQAYLGFIRTLAVDAVHHSRHSCEVSRSETIDRFLNLYREHSLERDFLLIQYADAGPLQLPRNWRARLES